MRHGAACRRHRRRHRRRRLRARTAARRPPRHDRRTGRARRRTGRQLRQRHAAQSEFGHSDVRAGHLEEGAGLSARSARAAGDPLVAICRSCCPGCGGSSPPVATEARVAAIARALQPLLAEAPERHRALAEEAGVGDLITRQGVLFAFPDRAAFEAEALSWRLRRDNGMQLAGTGRGRTAPARTDARPPLQVRRAGRGERPVPRSRRLCGGAGAARRAPRARRLRRARATGFRIEARRLRAVLTDGGRHRVRQGGDRGRCVVEAAGRRCGRSRAVGDRARLSRA